MTSNFQTLARNKPHHNLIAWYSSSVLTSNSLVIYGRDDSNRDLLIEIDGIGRGLSFIEQLAKHKYLLPFVISSADIWYYEAQRQLCASVKVTSKLGIVTSVPQRKWKFEVLSVHSLADWEPKDAEDERCDFFVFRTPDPNSWILKTASNGNDYSQLTFQVRTGKVVLQVWHRLADDDVPQLASPQQYPANVRVALTNLNIKLIGHATLAMNSTCWSSVIKLEEPLLPPEPLCAEASALDICTGGVRGLEETDLPRATWVDEGEALPATQSKKKKHTPKKTEVTPAHEHKSPSVIDLFDEQVESEIKTENTAVPKPTKISIVKSVKESLEGAVCTPTSPVVTQAKAKKEKKSDARSQKDIDPEKTAGDDTITSKGPAKKLVAPKGTPFPQGKKGTDFIGKRVTVKGKGEGVIMGGGAVKIRIMFDVDASMKADSLIGVDKVFLL